jgi:hypothetical protein
VLPHFKDSEGFNFSAYLFLQNDVFCKVSYVFKHGPANPSQQYKRASNSIQDPLPRWILMIFKLKFGGGNLFSPGMTSTIEGNNSMGSLLEPLLKKVTL